MRVEYVGSGPGLDLHMSCGKETPPRPIDSNRHCFVEKKTGFSALHLS